MPRTREEILEAAVQDAIGCLLSHVESPTSSDWVGEALAILTNATEDAMIAERAAAELTAAESLVRLESELHGRGE